MARRRRKRNRGADGEIDMTPMIDVVFQLIIFFIVTIKLEETSNPDIELAEARQGPTWTGHPQTLVIEVDRRGWISINNAQLTPERLRLIMQNRYNRMGVYPVMIRGDQRTPHAEIRKVMDIATAVGLWQIDFAAIKQPAGER